MQMLSIECVFSFFFIWIHPLLPSPFQTPPPPPPIHGGAWKVNASYIVWLCWKQTFTSLCWRFVRFEGGHVVVGRRSSTNVSRRHRELNGAEKHQLECLLHCIVLVGEQLDQMVKKKNTIQKVFSWSSSHTEQEQMISKLGVKTEIDNEKTSGHH